jgi:hypothetical protein
MAQRDVATWEQPLATLLTAVGAVITAAGGLTFIASVTGLVRDITRGSERVAMLAVALLVLGIMSLTLTHTPLGDAPKRRRLLLFLALILIPSAGLLAVFVPLNALSRDQRPVIQLSVSSDANPKLSGMVTAAGLSAGDRLATKVTVNRGGTLSELLATSTGSDSHGVATIPIEVRVGTAAVRRVTVAAWLPDRNDETPDCTNELTPAAQPSGDVLERFLAHAFASPAPYVACWVLTLDYPTEAGPRVSVLAGSVPHTAVVTVGGPAKPGEAILLQVWNRSAPPRLLHASLIFPGADGTVTSSVTVDVGPKDADVCALAIQAQATALPTVQSSLPNTCEDPRAPRQGWSELMILATSASPSASP